MVFPADPVTVSGTRITVDRYLRQPLEIARDLSDLTLQRYFAEAIFELGDDAPAGAVVYDEVTDNLIWPDRDVQRHTPGSQFPVIITTKPTPKTAYAEEYGGKFYMTYTATRRNAVNDFTRNERLLGNALVRKWNAIAIGLLNAAVDAVGASAIIAGQDWGTSTTDIFANLASGKFAFEQDELGFEPDTLIVNPAQGLDMLTSEKFRKLFTEETQEKLVKGDATIGTVRTLGLTVLQSFRQTAGTALLLQRRVVGGRHHDAPGGDEGENISTDSETGTSVQTWDDPENTRRWVQGWKSQVLYVNNPYAIKRLEAI
jgi:hypothetical protein